MLRQQTAQCVVAELRLELAKSADYTDRPVLSCKVEWSGMSSQGTLHSPVCSHVNVESEFEFTLHMQRCTEAGTVGTLFKCSDTSRTLVFG